MLRRMIAFGWLLVAVPATALAAEDTTPGPWNYGAIVGLNVSESVFSDNWSGGDKGVINWVANAHLEAQRQVNERFHWQNSLKLAFGETQKQTFEDGGNIGWTGPEKTTDQILLESTGRFTLRKWVDPYLGFRAESQFVDESSPVGNLNLNPIKLSETGGIARVFQKTEESEIVSRLGFGLRQSLAREFTDDTGDATERFTTNDGGFEFKTDVSRPLLEGEVLYKGQLLVFLPIFFSESDALKEYDTIQMGVDANHEAVADFWKSPDVNFQNEFTSEITSWLDVSLFLQLVYDKFDSATKVDTALDPAVLKTKVDKGIRKAGQFKQTLAIGLSYRFL